MHQDIDEKQIGNLNFPVTVPVVGTVSLPVNYDARFEQEKEWNFLVGGSAQLSEQINISVEGGFGNRKQVMGNLTFRF
jgi:hypothetical protein